MEMSETHSPGKWGNEQIDLAADRSAKDKKDRGSEADRQKDRDRWMEIVEQKAKENWCSQDPPSIHLDKTN